MAKPNKATILLVDDKESNILSLEALLASKDRILLRATSGTEALKITLDNDINLIILDVQMPGMDGFEVAQILKSNKKTKDIPIIFATAESKERKSMMKGYEEGAIDYLFKPLDPSVVKAKVAVLLTLELQRRELLEKNLSLQKSELLINNSADVIGIVDARSLKIEQLNDAFYELTGYSPAEISGMTLALIVANEHRERIQQLSSSSDEHLNFETKIHCRDRSIKWLHWKVVCRNGKWFVNARDITEIKEVEQIKSYLATVVKQSGDAIYIQNSEGKIISWNDGAQSTYGYTEEEAVKMSIWNLIPPNIQVETEKLLGSVLNGEKANKVETKRITKHGKLIDVLFSATNINEKGSDTSSVAITERDITQEKIAARQIRQSELKFRQLFNNAPYPMWVYDTNSLRFLEVNDTAVRNYGYTREEFLSMKITDIRPPDQVEMLKKFLKSELDNGKGSEWIHRLRSGDTIKVEISSHLLDHQPTAELVIAKDITSQKEAEEKIKELNGELRSNLQQLRSINNELESFSYSVSHDLRAPLRALSGYSKMLEEDFGDVLNDEGKRLLGNIASNARRMGILIDDLLSFSRLGRKDIQKSEIDMDEIVETVMDELELAFVGSHFTVHPLPPASGDFALLRQVWLNLISNAVKYSSKMECPKIEIGSHEDCSEIIYYIKDNGAGFDMKYADKLFGVFQRLHNQSEFEGTGIGLAIVQRIVAKHGGRVWAKSEPGKGAIFYFSLPKR